MGRITYFLLAIVLLSLISSTACTAPSNNSPSPSLPQSSGKPPSTPYSTKDGYYPTKSVTPSTGIVGCWRYYMEITETPATSPLVLVSNHTDETILQIEPGDLGIRFFNRTFEIDPGYKNPMYDTFKLYYIPNENRYRLRYTHDPYNEGSITYDSVKDILYDVRSPERIFTRIQCVPPSKGLFNNIAGCYFAKALYTDEEYALQLNVDGTGQLIWRYIIPTDPSKTQNVATYFLSWKPIPNILDENAGHIHIIVENIDATPPSFKELAMERSMSFIYYFDIINKEIPFADLSLKKGTCQ